MQPQHFAEMRRCLIDCDVTAVRRLWKHVAPGMSQPSDDAEALVTIHMARTCTEYVPFKLRAYSHRWLVDQGYPSQLPDQLKPRAEQIYPQIVNGVGIAVGWSSEIGRVVAPIIRGAMADVVMDIYSDDPSPDPAYVKRHMMDARKVALKKLIGKGQDNGK